MHSGQLPIKPNIDLNLSVCSKQGEVGRYKSQASYWNLRLAQSSFPLTMFHVLIFAILLVSFDLIEVATCSKG